MTSRRRFLAGVGSAAALGLAGCVETSSTEESTTSTTESATESTTTSGTTTGGTTSAAASTPTLKVGTTQSYVDAVSTSAGDWVKREFEAQHDAELEWVVRENELNDFIQRKQQGVDLGADMYVGVTPTDLVRADETLDASLFESFDTDRVQNAADIEDAYHFDPQNRVLPTGSSYVCIVYDEGEIEEPTTLENLTEDAWANSLLLPNPQNTVTGFSFLLWTVEAFGEDGYLDYWDRLVDNDLRTTSNWNAAYSAYSNQEAPMVMSYSTDQVYAAQSDSDMSRHQIAFPNNQGYAYVSGVARFAGSDTPELAHTFADFLLDAETQQTTAVKNVGIPVVSDASLPEDMQQYAHVPEEKLQFGYETLKNSAGDWREKVSRKIASQ